MIIQNNTLSSQVYPRLAGTTRSLAEASIRLTTGEQTANGNRPSTMALSNSFRGKIAGTDHLVKSLQIGLAFARAQEGILSRIGDIVVRMTELASSAVDQNKSLGDRQALQSEFSVLVDEIQNYQSNKVKFIGKNLISNGESFRYGISTADVISITALVLSGFAKTGFSYMTISTAGAASVVLASLSRRLGSLAKVHAQTSESISRINVTIDATQQLLIGMRAFETSIRNIDIATETATFIAAQVQQQAAESVMSQANLSAQNMLRFLNF